MSPFNTMVTIDEVKAAQRTAPLADATRALQREYEAQRSAVRREAAARRWREAEAAKAERFRCLTAEIKALRLCTDAQLEEQGMKLVAIAHQTAAYYGMAPKVAGGWVAVHLPFGSRYLYAALIPLSFSEGGKLTTGGLREAWLAIAYELEHLEDILHFLSTLAVPTDLEVATTAEDIRTIYANA